jgi:hypothetical protein
MSIEMSCGDVGGTGVAAATGGADGATDGGAIATVAEATEADVAAGAAVFVAAGAAVVASVCAAVALAANTIAVGVVVDFFELPQAAAAPASTNATTRSGAALILDMAVSLLQGGSPPNGPPS